MSLPLDTRTISLSSTRKAMNQTPTNIADTGPTSINHIVASGDNIKVVESIKIALEASFASQRPMPHVLLEGGPGTGKSLYGSLICRELAVEPVIVLGQTLRTAGDMNGVLVGMTEQQHVLVIDEIQTLSVESQTSLLRAMENNEVFIEPRGGRGKPVTIKLAKLTVIGCTTNGEKVLEPLRDRFRLALRLSAYSAADIETLLRQRVRQLGWEFDDAIFPMVAARSRGVPRLSLRLAESIWRTATADGCSVIRIDHAHKTFDLEGIDEQGLNRLDREYLSILADADGPVRLNVLATRLPQGASRTSRSMVEISTNFEISSTGRSGISSDARALTVRRMSESMS